MASPNVINITSANFDQEVLKAAEPVLVDFWAPWCGPCKMIAPVLDEIADANAGKFKICKLNVDDEPALAGQFGIRAIPALIFFKGGQPQAQMTGLQGKQSLIDKLQSLA
jgi:thioredoxin 1